MDNKELFQELSRIRQHETRGQQLDLFQTETPKAPVSLEYWFYSDLYNLFSSSFPPISQAMEKTVHENLIYPYEEKPTNQQSFDFCWGHYDTIRHAYKLNYIEYKNATDLKLSRYTCWSLLKQRPCMIKGHPNTFFAQTYFMSPVFKENIDFDTLSPIVSEYERIELRQRLSRAEKILSGIINSAHRNPYKPSFENYYRDFYNSTSLALFNGQTYADIQAQHHLPTGSNTTLLDYMGKHTLHARIAALYRTFERYNNSTNKSLINLNDILCDELFNKRVAMINATGMRPEQNISQQRIDKVKKDLEDKEKDFKKQYSIQKIR
ncbi:MAG: hypothetical protein IKZ34_03020 [Alphaproteobacteria bacterium]|nr:hypothetical protein [Alphaproteobacteria bacterium]